MDTTSELLFNYQVVGGVPYVYEIGQYEITASQYCTFLNAVDPDGDNPKQPWTKVKLWNKKNNPLVNHFRVRSSMSTMPKKDVITFWQIRCGLISR